MTASGTAGTPLMTHSCKLPYFAGWFGLAAQFPLLVNMHGPTSLNGVGGEGGCGDGGGGGGDSGGDVGGAGGCGGRFVQQISQPPRAIV